VTVHTTTASQRLVVAEPFDSSWSANGQPASEELGAVVGFGDVPTGAVAVTYGRWPVVRDSYIASGMVVLLFAALIATPVARRRRRPPGQPERVDAFSAPAEPLREPVLQHGR
jgi:hypothetical protein